MRSVFVVCFLLSMPVLAQEASKPTAVPSRRLVTRGEMYSPLQEIYLDLEGSAGKPGDMIAMRICSGEPLPVAMFLAVVNPLGVGERIAKEGMNGRVFFSQDRIMILRSPDCSVTHPPYVPLEFWGVPKGATLPPFVESAKLCQVLLEGRASDELAKNQMAYRQSLKKVVAEARASADAVVIVLGEYNVRPSSSMRSALREAKSFLKQSRLPQNRYFVRIKPSAYYDPEYSAGGEPNIPAQWLYE
jgi:hypothetical protein